MFEYLFYIDYLTISRSQVLMNILFNVVDDAFLAKTRVSVKCESKKLIFIQIFFSSFTYTFQDIF